MSIEMSQTPKKIGKDQDTIADMSLNKDQSTAKKLLKFAGAWEGEDIEECLQEVYKVRGEATF
jgi:hypothetical protein